MVSDGPYDAIASIGMAEHVGAAMLPVYAGDPFALLRPGGRLDRNCSNTRTICTRARQKRCACSAS